MTDLKVIAKRQAAAMGCGSSVFDVGCTPIIQPQVMRLSREDRVAFWDGFLASCVNAMAFTIGDKATQEVCEDLYSRAKDIGADIEKLKKL